MSKVAQYLNEHLVGEAVSAMAIRERHASDGGVLSIEPELVVFPRITNDVRKIARFSWQLAEKGHVLSITPRGEGTTTTGASIGSGMSMAVTGHLSGVLDMSEKDKKVHLRAGTSLAVVSEVLRWHRQTLPGLSGDESGTIGGLIASAARGGSSGKYGSVADATEQLEVVLANGDLMETKRYTKKDVNKKKGLQTFEGEIYRQIDGLIEDNLELIQSLSSDKDSLGYAINEVKRKDGSIDLTPLFVGSQGTLGIITEAVLRTEFYNSNESVVIAMMPSLEVARDIADQIIAMTPKQLDIIDSGYASIARSRGKSYTSVLGKNATFEALLYASFDDFSDRVREKKVKKVMKLLTKQSIQFVASDTIALEELRSIRRILEASVVLSGADNTLVPLLEGAHIPKSRFEEFRTGVDAIIEKTHTTLPIWYDIIDEIVVVRPALYLKRVSDKQKVFKLASLYGELVQQIGGTVAGSEAEGRINSFAAYPFIDQSTLDIYDRIRKIFDPFGTLNPGVKQKQDVKKLIRALRNDYAANDIL